LLCLSSQLLAACEDEEARSERERQEAEKEGRRVAAEEQKMVEEQRLRLEEQKQKATAEEEKRGAFLRQQFSAQVTLDTDIQTAFSRRSEETAAWTEKVDWGSSSFATSTLALVHVPLTFLSNNR
jgi:hypothetical protein